MILDKSQILELAKADLPPADRKNTLRLEAALAAALEDLGLRLRPKGMLKSYTVSVAADTRNVTLSGENDDMHGIYAVKWGSGQNERVLDFVHEKRFLQEYDSDNADNNYPSKFTQLTSDDGMPIIRFDVPTLISETLTVYYFPQLSSENIGMARSAVALATGTVAYFLGRGTELGLPYYRLFEHLAALTKSNQDFIEDDSRELLLSKEDHDIRSVFRSLPVRRSV